MIRAENLTKKYSGHYAVNHISFHIKRGEIVGFLGPNGAGKTTTIRMLTGYLPATSGKAAIAGYDVFKQSLQARRKIGYMPENVPIYKNMRVKEYLKFRATLKGIRGREVKKNVGEVIDICGLHSVRKKMIGALSKGYRQRTGLADALVHKPELLILDEPTNGLDPNQIRQARNLIKQLGENYTVFISTHILSEVEMTCGKVIIIDRGQIKAADTPKNLVEKIRTAGTIYLEAKDAQNRIPEKLTSIPDIKKVTKTREEGDWTLYTIKARANTDIREEIYQLAQVEKWSIRELYRKAGSLEEVFVELTQS